jgi:hypothetical protein
MSATSASGADDVVDLRVVDSDNVRAIIDLSVSEAQAEFVAPNVWSLAEAYAADHVWVRASDLPR